jgi:lysyl-tRNA synthetase class 2
LRIPICFGFRYSDFEFLEFRKPTWSGYGGLGDKNKSVAKNWSLARRKSALQQRANILQAIRDFFITQGFFEVETPHRIPAPAPESYIDAIPSGPWFLHTSPELCMKRMVAAGYEKIFQICRCWREGERGSQHIPEFTLLEWYHSGIDYRILMEECATLIKTVASKVGLGERIIFRNQAIDLSGSWERIPVREVFHDYAKTSMEEALKNGIFDELMARDIEPRLGIGKPTFICDYPAQRGALARLKSEDRTVAERFELYVGGLELANGFSELVDPDEQKRRFEKENENRREMGKSAYAMPEKFLEELKEMPPSGGIALGIDRLVMIFLDAPSIDEVVAFTPEEL